MLDVISLHFLLLRPPLGAYDPEVDGPVLADQCTKLFKIMCGKKRNTAVSKVAVRDATAINEAPK